MKLKKCLLTSFSLGLSAITIGAVVSSCASPAVEATDPNPASANSISTNPGDPLTPEQQDYQQKLAAEIKVQFDANASLDYSKPEDKANIDNQIVEYTNQINNGNLKDLITKLKSLDLSSENYDKDSYPFYSDFYDNFRQKNLLPTEKELDDYYFKESDTDSKTYWKAVSGIFAVFYSDPKSIILLNELFYKSTNNLFNLLSNNFFSNFANPIVMTITSWINEYPNDETGNIYKDLLNNLKELQPPLNPPLNPAPSAGFAE